MGNKKAVKLKSGELLIGEIVGKDHPIVKLALGDFLDKFYDEKNTIFLLREKKLSYLSRKDEVKSIRDAHHWEREKT
ncbi:hypothetical protein [Oceanobacillus kimchii]|uniref:hypothetical protein n=1 Tax=Oceanobacillus kimchii TaxID=746691 RepID=UPI003C74C895